MKKYSAFQLALALMLALVVVAGAWSPALAQDGGEETQQDEQTLAPGFKNDIFSGRSGLFAAGGLDPEAVTITKEDRGDGFGQIRLARNPITIEADSDFLPMTYVYFDLWPWQARAYDNENLKIFYKNENGGWTECPSFTVNQSTSPDDGEAEGKMRIACIATRPGTYAIGTDNPDAVSTIFP